MKTPLLFLALIVAACSDAPQPAAKPQLAFVTNGVGPFWTIAAKGVKAAAAEFAADAEVQMPGEGVADQKRIIGDAQKMLVFSLALGALRSLLRPCLGQNAIY